jgi:pyrimidine oxygenase
MAVTIDSISQGRFGINIISGWQRREYTQMGIWPGAEHYRRRYDYCAEYVGVMRELWATGRSDFKGDFFQMDDCRCLPMPTARIPIICAGKAMPGPSLPLNTPTTISVPAAASISRARWNQAWCGWWRRTRRWGAIAAPGSADGDRRRDRRGGDGEMGALQGRHRYRGACLSRRASLRRPQSGPLFDEEPAPHHGVEHLPTNQGVFVGSYAAVAQMLDEMATVPGVRGVMLTFDDFVIGMEQFGQRIQPLMKCRAAALAATSPPPPAASAARGRCSVAAAAAASRASSAGDSRRRLR